MKMMVGILETFTS